MSKSICLDIRHPEQAAVFPHPGAFLVDHLRLAKADYLMPLVKTLEGYQRILLIASDKKKACEFRARLMGWGFVDVVCFPTPVRMGMKP